MRKSGGAVIPMQLNSEVLNKVVFLTGSAETASHLQNLPPLRPFTETVVNYLNDVSREIIRDPRSRAYSDVVTFGFWIRKASVMKLKERFQGKGFTLGKGTAFHIAPSNVPVNFAYSLAAGLLCGNANVVRVPYKEFPQITILTDAINRGLEKHAELRDYVLCVRYERNKDINDFFSAFADVRIIWGGDQTIAELRRSPLPPRSGEITFADRYSMAVIDSDAYLAIENKERVAEDFYNDTFFSDQNACTSPRIIVWTGKSITEAKRIFWELEHALVKKKYAFMPIQAVNKLTKTYLIAAVQPGIKVEAHPDNLIVRIRVPVLMESLMDFRDNSGYFYEYDCKDILELLPICSDKKCQTIAYIGSRDSFLPLLKSGIKGIDRIVPIGKTMDFDLIWDGYQLPSYLTRTIVLE